mmetsp:Transcript_21361/g.30972  ORF Transcript_21361/g.30972 Transcript_21361/m.30972 type:complete len:298 (-) Transcript_21361:80-973(-)
MAESAPVKVDPAEFGYNLSCIRGIYQNPMFKEEDFNDLIANFETRDDDVFICTYVKAGTTWTQQIITLLLNGGEQGSKSYGEQCPWLEAMTNDFLGEREAPGHTLESIKSVEGPRFFKTHANFADLPRGTAGVKVIYVARNPKDTCVSLFHHAKNKPEFGYKDSFDTFMKLFLAGACENSSWFNHVREWKDEADKPDSKILFLMYEDMVDDPKSAIVKIADFIGVEATEEVINKTVENSSMKSMKANTQANALAAFNHLRKGGYGGWKDTFTVAQNEIFDQVFAEKMEGSGITVKFC